MQNIDSEKEVLLIGCGKMGGALLSQWVNHESTRFTVCDPAELEVSDKVTHVKSTEGLDEKRFDNLIVAIKPQLIDGVLPDYERFLLPEGALYSIAAGASFERLQRALDAPVIRIMPNLPSLIGRGVAGLVASDGISPSHRTHADELMALAGTTVWVDSEDGLDRLTAVSGSGPGYVLEFARTYIEAAQALGFSTEQARDLVLGTISGTIEMASSSGECLETLRNNVTSKNGTTEAGLNALNLNPSEPLSHLILDAVTSAYNRAVELR